MSVESHFTLSIPKGSLRVAAIQQKVKSNSICVFLSVRKDHAIRLTDISIVDKLTFPQFIIGDDLGKIWVYDIGEQLAVPQQDDYNKFVNTLQVS